MDYSTEDIRAYYRLRFPDLKMKGGEWRGPCPAHRGKDDNFTVNPRTGDAYCHSRCGRGWSITQLEMELSGCEAKDAAARISSRHVIGTGSLRKVAEYDYRDESCNLLFQVIRYEPKTFRQRRPAAYGTWVWGLEKTRRVLYRLPEILSTRGGMVHVCEGEKDVHSFEAQGLAATCNPGGAGKWRPEYSQSLRGRMVCIVPDNDEPGLKHGMDVARSLFGVAGSVWWLRLPEGHKDVSDFFNAGGTYEQLTDIAFEIRDQAQIADLVPQPKVVCIADSRRPEPVPEKTLPDFPDGVWTGFAKRYRDMMRDVTEAPPSFHMAGLLTAAGCLMGRTVSMKLPRLIYGNLFTLLVGSTSMARKTTALQFSCDLVMKAAMELGVRIKPLYGLASVEGLAANMMEKDGAPVRVFAIEDEFRSLLKKGQQKSVSNLIPRLTEAYNHLPTFEVNTRTDRVTVNGFFLSMAAASTPEWFTDAITSLEISGGFLNRWCIFTGRAERPIPRPDPVPKGPWNELVSNLVLGVSNAAGVDGGRRSLSDSAGLKYDEFYNGHWRQADQGQTDQATARLAVHALKFGMILSVMEGHDRIEEDDMERGIAIAKYCADTAAVLACDVGVTKGGALEKRVLGALESESLSAGELIRKLRVSADDLNRAAKALESAGMIYVSREPTGGRARVVFSLAA